VIAGRPVVAPPIPPALGPVLAGARAEVVWQNERGGLTIEATDVERYFVKWAAEDSGLDLAAEAARLRWATAHATVPRVLAEDGDASGRWLITTALTGSTAVAPRWRAAPAVAVTAIGAGLRALHEALPVDSCPFMWSIEDRVADAGRRAERGMLRPANWHPEHHDVAVEEALDAAGRPPPIDKLVVCHGDACAPNTLLDGNGRPSGHVDLGALGVADRWADLAVASWSCDWNYGPGWQHLLFDAYGLDPDPGRIAYYRLLWDLGP
jgi:kanamycin kinase